MDLDFDTSTNQIPIETIGDIPTSRYNLVFKRDRFWPFWGDLFLTKSDTVYVL